MTIEIQYKSNVITIVCFYNNNNSNVNKSGSYNDNDIIYIYMTLIVVKYLVADNYLFTYGIYC